MEEDAEKSLLDFHQIRRGEKVVQGKVLHEQIVLVHCFPSVQRSRKVGALTDIGRLLEPGIRDERDSCMEALGMLEDVEREHCSRQSRSLITVNAPIGSLLNCSSIPSSAFSMLNQKLTS